MVPTSKSCAGPVLLFLGLTLSPGELQSEPTAADRAAAQTLFDDGMALMKGRRYAEACPKLAESQRLDPGLGTLFNLSDCYEQVGRLASAWAGFREVADLARVQGQKKRADAASARAAALQPRLPTITIEVQGDRPPGFVVLRDGVAVGEGQWGTAVPVDPGAHVIEASAPGKQAIQVGLTIARDGQSEIVRIPPLPDVQPPSTPVPPRDGVQPQAPPRTPRAAPAEAARPTPADASAGTARTWAYVLGGVGLLGLGASGYFAVQARSRYDDSLDHCSQADKNLCAPAGKQLRDDARRSGTYTTVTFALGASALTGGVVLWAASPSKDVRATIHGAPVLAQDGGGLVLGGLF